MSALRVLFSRTGLIIGIYLLIGVFLGPPGHHAGHLPSAHFRNGGDIGAWLTFGIQVLLWPIGVVFHHPSIRL